MASSRSLEATGGVTYAQLPRYATADGKGTNDPKACTEGCVKGGSKYVLFKSDKTFYELDNQKKPAAFAGQKVEVTGSLDKSTKTIHVIDIKAAS